MIAFGLLTVGLKESPVQLRDESQAEMDPPLCSLSVQLPQMLENPPWKGSSSLAVPVQPQYTAGCAAGANIPSSWGRV